jgi:S-adenosylmethionine hydrolase
VYAYTGARLASDTITFDEVGRLLPASVVSIGYQKPLIDGDVILGNIPILDIQYGNIWTNIDRATFRKLEVANGDVFDVVIEHDGATIFEGQLPYFPTFGYVDEGEPMMYLNSVGGISFAINQGSFADTYEISSGPGWGVKISRK